MSYLFNITFNIQFEAVDPWLAQMKEVVIPELQANFTVDDMKLFKLMTELDNGGETYSMQFLGSAASAFPKQIDAIEANLSQAMLQKFPGQHVMFSTLLREELL